mmetsp:Transcript_29558/g.65115  ORF Transcript_29558/g.65115 Transcript_29558/m.65115 type:complete len:351 (+) Transcript_29558:88-1140(+)
MERLVAIIPHENDILMGRGGKNNQHVGNERLRVIAQERRESYVLSDKQGKFNISRAIVVEIRRLVPPGRFLKRNDKTGEWEDVGDDKAREKVSQALRDAGRPVVAMKKGGRSPSSSPDIEGGGGGGGRDYDREVIPYTIASNSTRTRETSYNNDEYQRRAYSAPTVVTSSRYQPQYAYTPPSSSEADHQLHRHHHQHHHYHQYYYRQQHHQQYHHQYASGEPASAFEPPPPRLRHYTAPAVAPVVTYSSQDDIPRSPINFSVAKKQRTEGDTSALHPYVHMSAAPRPAVPKGEDSAATSSAAAAAAAPEREEEFDLFNGGLLQQDEPRRDVARRSKRDYGEFQLSSNKTF